MEIYESSLRNEAVFVLTILVESPKWYLYNVKDPVLSTVAILIEPKRPEPLPQSAGRIIAFPPGQALQDGRFDLIPIFHPQKKQD